MFGNKKTTTSPNAAFAEKIKAAKYERIYLALKSLLQIEVKGVGADGKEKIDYAATCSAMKTKARLVIDFVDSLDKNGESEN